MPDQLALWFATWAKAIGHFRGWTLPGWWPGVSGCSLGFAVVPHCYRWLFWGHWCDMNAWMCNFNDVQCQVVPFKNTREVPNSIEQAKYQCRSIFDDWLSFPIPLGCCTCSRFYSSDPFTPMVCGVLVFQRILYICAFRCGSALMKGNLGIARPRTTWPKIREGFPRVAMRTRCWCPLSPLSTVYP